MDFKKNPFSCPHCFEKMVGDSNGDIIIRNRVLVFEKSVDGPGLLAKCVKCYSMVKLPFRFVLNLEGGQNGSV